MSSFDIFSKIGPNPVNVLMQTKIKDDFLEVGMQHVTYPVEMTISIGQMLGTLIGVGIKHDGNSEIFMKGVFAAINEGLSRFGMKLSLQIEAENEKAN